MRIGIEATAAIKQLGGVSEYTKQLIKHLAAIDQANRYDLVTFSLFRYRTTPLPTYGKNFRKRDVPMPATVINRMWRQAGIPQLEIFIGRPDLLFFPSVFMPYSWTPTVVTVHDLAWLRFPDVAPPGEGGQFRSSLLRAVRTAKKIITISEATKQDLMSIARVPASKIAITYLGYDESIRQKPQPQQIQKFRKDFRLGSAPYFLHVGTIEPRKNLTRLVKAFDLFKTKTKLPHELVLVGRMGWRNESLQQAIAESDYQESIVLLGSLTDSDRRLAYWGAEAVVFPSLYEGFGIPVLEGQAANKPVLTGTGGSLKEVGKDSVMVVDVLHEQSIANGLEQLATDTKLRQALVHKGLSNIKRFSWEKMAKETLQVFEEVGHGKK